MPPPPPPPPPPLVLRFWKMQGLGNDFVVVDGVRQPHEVVHRLLDPDHGTLKRLADRRFGVGFDQLLLVQASATAPLSPAASTSTRTSTSTDSAENAIDVECVEGAKRVDDAEGARRVEDIDDKDTPPRSSTGSSSNTAQCTPLVYRIFNADGGEVFQCGNGARCVAAFVKHLGLWSEPRIRVRTLQGTLLDMEIVNKHQVQHEEAQRSHDTLLQPGNADAYTPHDHQRQSSPTVLASLSLPPPPFGHTWQVKVGMGVPRCSGTGVLSSAVLEGSDITCTQHGCTLRITRQQPTLQLSSSSSSDGGDGGGGRTVAEAVAAGELSLPGVPQPRPVWIVDMGNPHAVVLLDTSVDDVDVHKLGSALQSMRACFPDSVNVEFMQVLTPTHVRLRIFERGAGETLACGTGACAAVAAAVLHGHVLASAGITVSMRGGDLTVHWTGHPHAPLTMTGPATCCFAGAITL
ncbi:diaminopimelate epimerase [Salpingoeca rosetta]|uniref:diaminopimelate epimerase n=1 Tax=Salpingoeca rosetta (strain ATCC 50818 / BSB-021) TaxID=946362 RepID=F2UM25_SALR5|nr:diaminopimelate epimerase [Salpingoeca rosetta]EGD78174.1 diaminopimelate epimerase [Salpingoeca rosetta]|eukprot:XP_004989850.1 diaminopimelate epimerase [Salpingoeca rosetta]